MKKEFIKNILTLVSGTAGAQLIALFVTPLLTRIYSPEEFGFFSIFISISLVLGAISCFRYEVTIPLPKLHLSAVNSLLISVFISVVIGVLVLAILKIIPDEVMNNFFNDREEYKTSLLYLSVFVILYAITQVFTFWKIRYGLYSQVAIIKFLQGGGIASLQVVLGAAFLDASGLVKGYIAGFLISAVLHVYISRKSFLKFSSRIRCKSLNMVFLKYKNFSFLSTSSALINNLGLHAPVFLFGYLFGLEVAGFLMLANRMLGGPINMLGQAIGNVYLGGAPKLLRNNPRELHSLFKDIVRKITLVGIIPVMVMIFISPNVFVIVFGDSWIGSGKYVQFLLPAFFIQLVVSPLSLTLVVLEKQKIQLLWDLLRLSTIVATIVLSYMIFDNALITVGVYGFVLFCLYLMLLVMINKELKNRCLVENIYREHDGV